MVSKALSVVPAGQVTTAGKNDVSLFAALATAAERRMSDFNSQGLAHAAWAFATASQGDVSLFAVLATVAEQRMSDFDSHGLANTAWALATASQSDVSLFAALATVPPFSVAWATSLVPVAPPWFPMDSLG